MTLKLDYSIQGAPQRPTPSGHDMRWLDPCDVVQSAQRSQPNQALREDPAGMQALGAPWLDFMASAMSARASLMAAETGRAFYAHERRGRLPMPEALTPEIGVWEHDELVPQWSDGVLTEPKYFSFFQDAPLAAFNPNHRRKWRSHELLHGVMGFYWSPHMTRFEMYLGTRLNELIPVVHWYGFDELFRARCPRHQRALGREHCLECEAHAQAFWEVDRTEARRVEGAQHLAQQAIEHLHLEWDACMRELERPQIVRTSWQSLDSSSDAIGYLHSHWPRCTAWSFGAWMEQFMVDGVDYCSTLDAYAQRIVQKTHALIHADVGVNLERFERLRARRSLQDVAYRLYIALEWLDEASSSTGAIEDQSFEVLDDMAAQAQSLLKGEGDLRLVDEAIERACEVVRTWASRWPGSLAQSFDALGYTWRAPTQAEVDQVYQGVLSSYAITAEHEQWMPSAQDVRAFVQDQGASQRLGTLRERFNLWSSAQEVSAWQACQEWADFECWALALPLQDTQGQLFSGVPSGPGQFDPRDVRLNTTARQRRFSAAFVQQLLGEDVGEQQHPELMVVHFNQTMRMVLVDGHVRGVLSMLQGERPWRASDWPLVQSLLLDGVLVWVPAAT